ncbi:MAG: hypothetical protein QM736_04715 [Vicinamibacterales bacterium]
MNLINASITVVAQIVVGVVLIPRLGVTGAALAMCVGFRGAGAVLRFAEAQIRLRMGLARRVADRLLVAAALAVVAWLR